MHVGGLYIVTQIPVSIRLCSSVYTPLVLMLLFARVEHSNVLMDLIHSYPHSSQMPMGMPTVSGRIVLSIHGPSFI